MPETAKKNATYDDLFRLPDNVTGQIIDGELYTHPRPHTRHAATASLLGGIIIPPFWLGDGGPGGWVILVEPEVMLGADLLVPDLAGWHKERLPRPPQENWIAVTPDWVCEITSPSTFRLDRVRKMPIYAEHGVPFLWLIDPAARLLEVFGLQEKGWMLIGNYVETDKVRAQPFQAIEIDLGELWWGE